MSTLREIVYNSVIAIHRRTGKEWIPLKEIYEEVDKNRDVGINNGGASVRAALETHSALSEVFSGTEEYILKEKGSGLYKSIYYDQIVFVNNITIGDVFTREQLMAIFKISGQSGIMKTNTLNCLVLVTLGGDGVYEDGLVENGLITYTGEGLTGDQTLNKNNKTIYESKEKDMPIYLFSKDKNRRYTFEGRVELNGEPYQVTEKDIEDKDRLVWKFPLKVVTSEEKELDEKVKEVSYQIVEIENKIYSEYDEEQNELQFVEGNVNIRKYRKTDRKIKRNSKPDYVAEEVVKSIQGEINEKKIYEQELERLMKEEADEQVKIMEEFFKNKKENEGYDILSFELDNNGEYIEKYIEVKSTKSGEGTPIDISADEIDFAMKHIDNYYLYRIYNSDSKNPQYKIISGKDLLQNSIYNLIPSMYKIYLN